MKTIEIRYRTIEDAATLLVKSAPAKGDFYGVPLRARYATTRPTDIVGHYRRIIAERAMSYGNRLTSAMRARLRCDKCGATGCKMWRGPCAMIDQKKTGGIDADGKHEDDIGFRCDQIGWMVPAVPVAGEDTYWGYTSVPEDGVVWWRTLPSLPANRVAA
jgi:hypothetical protein